MAKSVYSVVPGKLKGGFSYKAVRRSSASAESNLFIIFCCAVSEMTLRRVKTKNLSYL